MKNRCNKRWNEEEKRYLLKNKNKLSVSEIAKKLGRSPVAVIRYCEIHGIKITKMYFKKTEFFWTTKHKKFLRENINSMSNIDIAKHIGKTKVAVARAIPRYGFSRNEEFIKKICSAHNKILAGDKHYNWKGGHEEFKRRKKKDLKYQLNRTMSKRVSRNIKCGLGRNVGWQELVGYTNKELEAHLAKTIPHNYSWQDYLDGNLHLDHIIPLAVFNFTTYHHIDFKRCWALGNLRLLPAKENQRKGAKITNAFQPSLALEV
ncbi:MAG TPA: hypothetical protein ENH82_14705 [bacterium]|nr:hypothetical protein [bacterium]